MKTWPFLLAAALIAPLLAGCTDEAPPVPPAAIGPGALDEGGYYAFRHGGGDLVFAIAGDGSAEVVLYGADDSRIGRIGIGDDQASGRFVLDGVGRGDLVVQILELNGTLDVRSGGSRVAAYEGLPRHVERHILLQRPLGPMSVVGLSGLEPNPADESIELELLRAPSSLRLLGQGSFGGLDVRVVGSAGPVLQAQYEGGPFQPTIGPFAFDEIQSEGYGENVRDGHLTAKVLAAHFEGILLLEAESFSRARPAADPGEATGDVPRFTYGVLPDQPVSFQVRSGAKSLYLFQEGAELQDVCGDRADEAAQAGVEEACEGPVAWVALFGPHDERVATVRVPFNQTIRVPVTSHGAWVAVLLAGQATLGADLAPSDFELHPLDVRSIVAPSSTASDTNGEYAQASDDLDADGVVFRIHGFIEPPRTVFEIPFEPSPAQCGPSTLVAIQDGETIGAWGFDERLDEPAIDPSAFLDGGGLTLVHDDFGPDCDRMALLAEGYVR